MTPLPHEYQVTLRGTPAGYATLSGDRLPDLVTAPPPQFDGPGDAWSPEHLLLASVSACFLFTFRAVARASKLEFSGLDVRTSGTVAREAGITRFTDIVVHAGAMVGPGDTSAVQLALEKAKRHCLISSSLAVPVRIEATVTQTLEKCA